MLGISFYGYIRINKKININNLSDIKKIIETKNKQKLQIYLL